MPANLRFICSSRCHTRSYGDYRRRLGGSGDRSRGDWMNAAASERFAYGPASTVTQRLAEWIVEMGSNRIVVLMRFGALPHTLVRENIVRCSRDVMPRLKVSGVDANGVGAAEASIQDAVMEATFEAVAVDEAARRG